MATVELLELPVPLEAACVESLPFGQNSYVLFRRGQGECLVFDPGFEPQAIIDWIERHRLVPTAILLTHGHSDHIAGNAALRGRWPDLPILIGRGDARKLTDPKTNLSAPFGMPLTSPPADRLLTDGDGLESAGCSLEVRELPGHSSGHVVYVVATEGAPVVVGGDVLFREGIGRTDFPDGDHAALVEGIRRRLYALPDDTLVLPGHGPPTTVGHERRQNPFVSDPTAR
jgi:hydroxyacylglutathione hydrolase